jgi:hypothetical protein
MVRVRINLRPDGLLWRVGVIQIRSSQQHGSVQLDHLPPTTYGDAVELAKRQALELVGRAEDVEWDIHPRGPTSL